MSGLDFTICVAVLALILGTAWRTWKLQKAVERLSEKLSYAVMVSDSLQREIREERQFTGSYYDSSDIAVIADHRV